MATTSRLAPPRNKRSARAKKRPPLVRVSPREEPKTRARIRTATGLSIHVHHMNDGMGLITPLSEDGLTVGIPLVEIPKPPSESTTMQDAPPPAPVWIQVACVGHYRGHPAGPFELTPEVFEEIVANFLNDKLPIPIDFEHASEAEATSGSIPTDGAPAQGWIKELDNRRAGGLWALVEWGEKARGYIRSGAYRYISPAIRFNSRDRVTGRPIGARLTSAGITNQPFLKTLQPLAAKDRPAQVNMGNYAYTANEYMPRLRACMKLGETATAEQTLERLEQLEDLFESAGGALCTHQGVDLSEYLPAMRDTMQLPLSDSYEHMFEAIRELLHAAMGMDEEHDDGGPSSRDMRDQTMDAETTAKLRDAEAKISELSTSKVELSARLKMSEEQGAALSLRLKDAESKVAEFSATLAARDGELKAMRDADAQRAERELEARVDEAYATYKDRKNLSDHDKAAMRIVLKGDSATFEKLYPRVAPAQQHLLRSIATGPGHDAGPAPRPAKAADPQETFRALSSKYQKEGLSLEAAIVRANEETRAQFARA